MDANIKPIALVGASPDTGNQGVTALCYSVLDGLAQRDLAPLIVYDHGRGRRKSRVSLDHCNIEFDSLGAINGRRYYRPENLWQIKVAARAGGLWNKSARGLCRAGAVLDVSGGDSFTELYGSQRFRTVTLPKQIALRAGRRLILLPQTYGPFRSKEARAVASDIVRGARAAWARDEVSFAELKSLLGDRYDPERHHCGVDMAFGLPTSQPRQSIPQSLAGWLEEQPRTFPIIGLNVSGLLYNDPESAKSRFGLRDDYRNTVLRMIRQLLSSTDARVVLVPHVVVGRANSECDLAACLSVQKEIGMGEERLCVLHGRFDAAELKWVIARTDWFCGTRMHATIAGLSSGVPTVALAYSVKTGGVFETCGQGREVIDLRQFEGQEVTERMCDSWCRREEIRRSLAPAAHRIRGRAASQMDAVVSAIRQADAGRE